MVHPGVLVCGNWGILESDDAALVHRVWWGDAPNWVVPVILLPVP